jgi:hypothetical protein
MLWKVRISGGQICMSLNPDFLLNFPRKFDHISHKTLQSAFLFEIQYKIASGKLYKYTKAARGEELVTAATFRVYLGCHDLVQGYFGEATSPELSNMQRNAAQVCNWVKYAIGAEL